MLTCDFSSTNNKTMTPSFPYHYSACDGGHLLNCLKCLSTILFILNSFYWTPLDNNSQPMYGKHPIFQVINSLHTKVVCHGTQTTVFVFSFPNGQQTVGVNGLVFFLYYTLIIKYVGMRLLGWKLWLMCLKISLRAFVCSDVEMCSPIWVYPLC